MIEKIYINKVRDDSQKDKYRYEYYGVEGKEYVCELSTLRQKKDKDGNWTYCVSLKKLNLENKDYISTKNVDEGLHEYTFIERDQEKKNHHKANDSKKWIDKMEPKEKIEYEKLQNQVMELCDKMKQMEQAVKQRELEKINQEKLNNFGVDSIELLEKRLKELKEQKEQEQKELKEQKEQEQKEQEQKEQEKA